jgi:hypothetical protein
VLLVHQFITLRETQTVDFGSASHPAATGQFTTLWR